MCSCVCVWNLLAPRLFQCKSREATIAHRTNINTLSGGERLICQERSSTKWAKSCSVSDQKKAKNGFIEWEEKRHKETQTEWETDRQHTPVWGCFVLSSTRFGHTCLYECFHLESLTREEEISAQVPSSASRTKKRSKLSFTLAVFAPKQIIFSEPFTAVLHEVRSGCVLSDLNWDGDGERTLRFQLPGVLVSHCVSCCTSRWVCTQRACMFIVICQFLSSGSLRLCLRWWTFHSEKMISLCSSTLESVPLLDC